MVQFEEKQRFNQIWLWLLLLALNALFVWAFIQQIVLGRPFGDNPASDWGLMFFGLIPLVLLVLFGVTRLHTVITDAEIIVGFTPFFRKAIPRAQVVRARVRTYKAMVEFGGYGVRFGKDGLAYIVGGNQGLELEMQDGRKILIGTQRGEEIGAVMKG